VEVTEIVTEREEVTMIWMETWRLSRRCHIVVVVVVVDAVVIPTRIETFIRRPAITKATGAAVVGPAA
jgi:hypothetical protein